MSRVLLLFTLLLPLMPGCATSSGTEAPPGGWANTAPTSVEQSVKRGELQLLEVRQGSLRTWIQVPDVGAEPGDYVLLGQGTARSGVDIPEVGEREVVVVDIAHARVVDAETARRTVAASVPVGAIPLATVYDELDKRADSEVVVHGTVVKATSAVGSVWVHLRDGTGDAATGTDDLTVKAIDMVSVGQRVAYRGTLRKDVDLGFGYSYDALIEDAALIE